MINSIHPHRQMKKLFSKEFTIGISVIVALVILFFGIDYLKGINLFRPANFYYAECTNVQGLEIAAPVTIDGFKVGQVREIGFDYQKPGKIKVLLALDQNLKIPAGSYATLESSLLNGASVALHLGKAANQFMEVGSIIPTSTGPDLMAAVNNDIMPAIHGILPKVDSLLYNLNMLVADPALSQSIARLDGITANILGSTQALNTTMNSQVPVVMRSAGNAARRIDSITSDLTVLSAQLKALPLASTMDKVNAVAANLEQFSSRLNDPNSSLSLLMKDPQLYHSLNRVAADVDSLIVDIKKNPKRYISIKLL